MESVTQGDPLSMFVYAISTLPLIQSLKRSCSCVQVWYADEVMMLRLVGHYLISISGLNSFFGKGLISVCY